MISLSLVSNSFADEAVFLTKNKPAPFQGFLFTEEQAKDLRVKLIENNTDKALIQSCQKQLDLTNQINDADSHKISLCINQVNDLARANVDERSITDWKKIGIFSFGVIIGLLSAYAASKTIK